MVENGLKSQTGSKENGLRKVICGSVRGHDLRQPVTVGMDTISSNDSRGGIIYIT